MSDELFYDVQGIISDPARICGNPGAAQYALTGAIVCDRCSGPITVRYRSKEPTYECKKGHWRISKAELDAVFIGDAKDPGLILGYLSRRDVYEVFDADDVSHEVAEIRGQLAKAREDLRETEAAEPETLAEERRFARRAERLEGEIEELKERQRKLSRPTQLSKLFPPGPDVAGRWERASVATQRAIVAYLLSPEVFGQARIRPAGTARSTKVIDRIAWRHASSAA